MTLPDRGALHASLWQRFFSDSNLMGDGKGNLPEADFSFLIWLNFRFASDPDGIRPAYREKDVVRLARCQGGITANGHSLRRASASSFRLSIAKHAGT